MTAVFEASNFQFGPDDPAPDHVDAVPDIVDVRPGTIWLEGQAANGQRTLLATRVPNFNEAKDLWLARIRYLQTERGELEGQGERPRIYPPLFNE